MAIQWGSWVYSGGNGMRVGLDISWSGVDYTSTSTTATVQVWTQNQYNYSDGQTISYTNLGSNTNYTNNGSSGTSSLRATKSYTHTYGANPATINFRATLSGLYNGGSPTININSTTPTRPAPPPPPEPPPPPPPTLYAPTMTSASAVAGLDTVNVSWTLGSDGGSGITAYYVYRNDDAMPIYTSTGTSYADFVGYGQTVYYDVRAFNAIGGSNVVRTNTVTTPTIPTAPTSFSANTSTFGQIGLSWAAPSSNGGSAITGYRLRTGTTLGSGTLLYEGAGTSYTHTGLNPYTDYSYNITAFNAVGQSTSTTGATLTAKTMGGICKVWNGSSWVVALPKVWNGTSWVDAQARIWDGSQWKYGI
jgi:hypothetical protein